jgi:hypothetical protein
VVSFLAFLSGGCFGFYYSWRVHARASKLRLVDDGHRDRDRGDRRGLRAEIPAA